MTRNALPCGCIIRQYDTFEDALVEMDVEWCEIHERAEACAIELTAANLTIAVMSEACRVAVTYLKSLATAPQFAPSAHYQNVIDMLEGAIMREVSE